MAVLEAFEQLGWTNGRNVQIVARWSGGKNVELHKYAEELVALAPDVILAGGGTGGVGSPPNIKTPTAIGRSSATRYGGWSRLGKWFRMAIGQAGMHRSRFSA
jgi:hypothetical protein